MDDERTLLGVAVRVKPTTERNVALIADNCSACYSMPKLSSVEVFPLASEHDGRFAAHACRYDCQHKGHVQTGPLLKGTLACKASPEFALLKKHSGLD